MATENPSREDVKRRVLEIGQNLLVTATDLTLWSIYFGIGVGGGGRSSRDIYQAAAKADEIVSRINYQSFAHALQHTKEQGLTCLIRKAGGLRISLTEEGEKRIRGKIPQYKMKRPWDRKLYLITYDVPESKRSQRDKLRYFLNQILAVKLQESVYLSPYNHRKEIKAFVEENGIPGTVIVSDTGIRGSIGSKDFRTLVSEAYKLESLNQRYGEFIKEYGPRSTKPCSRAEVALAFNAVLQDDPQIPFDLLPNDWLGEEAYQLYLDRLA